MKRGPINPPALPDAKWHAIAARAIHIADSCMLSQLECHALPAGGPESRLFNLADANGNAVDKLADADEGIVEAFNWLSERGLAELVEDEHGEAILVSASVMER